MSIETDVRVPRIITEKLTELDYWLGKSLEGAALDAAKAQIAVLAQLVNEKATTTKGTI